MFFFGYVLKWEILKSPWVSICFNTTSWSDDLDDLGYPHDKTETSINLYNDLTTGQKNGGSYPLVT